MSALRLIKSSPLLEDLGQVIGADAVVRLCEALGGTRIYVPRTIGENHPLAAAIGMKAARSLAEHYYGTMLELPKAFHRRSRALELAKSGQLTAGQVALQTDYTERHVRRLLAAEDDGQLDLPF